MATLTRISFIESDFVTMRRVAASLAIAAVPAEEVRLSATQELFAEGSPGDRAYVVNEASLNLRVSLSL